MPNVMDYLKDWFHLGWAPAAGRLIWACIVTAIVLAIAFGVMRRPKPNRPVTWAESAAGAVFVFAAFLLCYAVIPSEWITFSDKYLHWTSDTYLVKHGREIFLGISLPFDIPKQAVRDTIAAGIYIVFFGANIALWSQWQKRPTVAESEAAETAEPKVIGRSRFGRPLKAKA